MRAWLREWLGVEEMSYAQDSNQLSIKDLERLVRDIAEKNKELIGQIELLANWQKLILAHWDDAPPAKVAKQTKPYRTASEIRNKLERSSEEKA